MKEATGLVEERGSRPASFDEIDRLNDQAWLLRTRDDWAGIIQLAGKAGDLARSCGYARGIAGSLRTSAFAHYMLSELRQATAQALESLRMFQEEGDAEGESHSRTVLAYVQWSLGNYDRALDQAMQALTIAEKNHDAWIIGWCSTLVGGIHDSLRDYEKALHFHVRSYQIFADMDEPIGQARTLIGIASAHRALGDSAQAIDCLNRSLEVFRRIENRIGESRALHDIACVYADQGREGEAIDLHLRALEIREREQNRAAAATSLLSLGKIYLGRGDHGAALEVLNRALDICLELSANPKLYQAHQLLSQVYEQQGDLKNALHHEREFHRIREIVFNEESSTRVRNLQTSFETERSHREAEMHRQRNAELKEKNEELARLLEELQATQLQLVHNEKMASLGALVAAFTHEMNSPLGTILSSCDVSQRLAERIAKAPPDAALVDAFTSSQQLLARGVRRIAEIVGNLKSFAHLDGAEFAEIDIHSALETVLALTEPHVPPRIRLVRDFHGVPRIGCRVAELNQVFRNLLENAVQAIDEDGSVTISTRAANGELHVRFSDTGRGIPADLLPRIFDAGIRTKGERARASVSLFTSLHIVRKHRGSIDVQSTPGQGTTFTVRLPLQPEAV